MTYILIAAALVFAYPVVSMVYDLIAKIANGKAEPTVSVVGVEPIQMTQFSDSDFDDELYSGPHHDAHRFEKSCGPQLYDCGGFVDTDIH